MAEEITEKIYKKILSEHTFLCNRFFKTIFKKFLYGYIKEAAERGINVGRIEEKTALENQYDSKIRDLEKEMERIAKQIKVLEKAHEYKKFVQKVKKDTEKLIEEIMKYKEK